MTTPDINTETNATGMTMQFNEELQGNLVCGYPKTGRTWLRYMLANALVVRHGIDLDVDFTNAYSIVPNDGTGHIDGQPAFMYEDRFPKIEMTHRPYEPVHHANVNRIFLTRDPRDIMVSHWLHNKNQIKIFDAGLDEFIRSPEQGLSIFIAHLESWAPYLSSGEVMSYESMRLNPVDALSKVFKSFRIDMPNDVLARVAEVSTLDKMRQKEIERGIAGHDYDRSDPEALRIRRGKVGGFTDYLTTEDETYIHRRIESISHAAQAIIALTGYEPTKD